MKRKICGFHKDERDDWVAELDCHHNQHVRNKPPFFNRPWVESVEGRKEHMGTELVCVLCDRFEFPDGLECYKNTREFREDDIPRGMLRDHSTKTGIWGLIDVSEGKLKYQVGERTEILEEKRQGVIVPDVPHSVSPIERVRFSIHFFRKTK